MGLVRTLPFTKIFNPQTGRTETLTGSNSIRACLGMLISTCRGELLGDPNFGTDIKKYLANYKGSILYSVVAKDIVNAVNKYEKRVHIDESNIMFNESATNPNLIYITIQYTNLTTNMVEELKLTLNSDSIL